MKDQTSPGIAVQLANTLKKQKETHRCERCGERLKATAVVWLEFSTTDGKYYTEIPKGHVSQGMFAFGKICAKNQLID
jgi:hypothetical protein